MRPSAHIFGLFLAPDELGMGRLEGEEREKLLFVEGIELLEAKNGGIADLVFFAIVGQVVKDFS